jgi:mannose/fructose/N-acetylgalactosamine-specific phosphotransferase system component IIC
MKPWEVIRYGFMGVAGIWVSFSLWRKMRSEYEQEKILSLFLVVAFSFVIGGIFGGWVVDHKWSWWTGTGVIGAIFALIKICTSMKWDAWEWWDELVQTGLGLGIIINLLGMKWISVISLCIGFVIVKWVNLSYRGFRWYRSGRMGLVGLIGTACWLINLLVVAFFESGGIYWFGLTPNYWLAILGLPLVIIVGYKRSGRKLSEDIRIWPKRKIKSEV